MFWTYAQTVIDFAIIVCLFQERYMKKFGIRGLEFEDLFDGPKPSFTVSKGKGKRKHSSKGGISGVIDLTEGDEAAQAKNERRERKKWEKQEKRRMKRQEKKAQKEKKEKPKPQGQWNLKYRL